MMTTAASTDSLVGDQLAVLCQGFKRQLEQTHFHQLKYLQEDVASMKRQVSAKLAD
jgi:hypothetical protein